VSNRAVSRTFVGILELTRAISDVAAKPERSIPDLPRAKIRRSDPQRLVNYMPPDMPAAARDLARGASLRSIWRRYVATATVAPIGYVAFTKRVKKWNAVHPARPEIAPGIRDYMPAEDGAADRYWADKSDPSSSIHVLAGFGCSLKIEHGLLTTFDTGTVRKFEPVNHRLSAIVFTGASGLVTIDAIKWCAAKGIGIFVLDWLGDLLSVTLPAAPDNVAIRRAQFAADPLTTAKAILRQKIAASFRIGKLSERGLGTIYAKIKAARSIESLLMIEAKAAIDYWGQWRFALKHKQRGWPPSWAEFTLRGSPITGNPRHAVHPVNAILNYAYGVVAGMCVRSLTSVGLDPCAGFLHADRAGRYSLAYDLLELLRPEIDDAMLSWIADHTWTRADFPVTRSGVVRLQPALARVVAQRTVAAVPPARTQLAAQWLGEVVLRQVPAGPTLP
jgi:CRISP-associated protein Cas1